MTRMICISIVMLWATAGFAVANKKICDNKEYQIADAKLSSVVVELKKSSDPWMDLLAVFKVWEPCMDKFQDEGFIDAIAGLVSTRWDRISNLVQIKQKHPTFYKYVISSLGNEIVGLDRWKKIVTLSKKKCPDGTKEICKDIELADQSTRN